MSKKKNKYYMKNVIKVGWDVFLGFLLGFFATVLLVISFHAEAAPLDSLEMMEINDRNLMNKIQKEKKLMSEISKIKKKSAKWELEQRILQKQRIHKENMLKKQKLMEFKEAKKINPELARYKLLKNLKKIGKHVFILKGIGTTNFILMSIGVYCSFYNCMIEEKKKEKEKEKEKEEKIKQNNKEKTNGN